MTKQGMSARGAIGVLCGLLLSPLTAQGYLMTPNPTKDNTLYESATGSLSNGAGQHFHAGRTGPKGGAVIRRALLAFDISGNIPAGSTITNVALTLNMSRTNDGAGPRTVSLHRALADWGEGVSDASRGESAGTTPTAGDATWIHTFFNTTFWTSPGGDFLPFPSASIVVDQIGFYTWGSTAGMVTDVQNWLDNPGSNFGWILIGDESTATTLKRFDSRQNLTPANRPTLTVNFGSPSFPAGRVPDGDQAPGTQLMVVPAGDGDITLSWGGSCVATDTDFEIYEGSLGNFTTHVARSCNTLNAASFTLTPSEGNRYYLLVPRNATNEGSYGTDSNGVERPQAIGIGACLPQAIAACP